MPHLIASSTRTRTRTPRPPAHARGGDIQHPTRPDTAAKTVKGAVWKRLGLVSAALAAALISSPARAAAIGTTTVVASSGDTPPSGGDTFLSLLTPVINDAGQAAFFAGYAANGFNVGNGTYRGNGSSPLIEIVRTGQPAPAGTGVMFGGGANPTLNNLGQAAVRASVTGQGVTSANDLGIYRGDGTTTVQVAREGDAAPGGVGAFSNFSTSVALNTAGQTAFLGFLQGTGVTAANDTGIYRGDGTSLVQVARTGQAAPAAGGAVFASLQDPGFNGLGRAIFVASLSGAGIDGFNGLGIYRGDGTTLTEVVRTNQGAPTGTAGETYGDFAIPPAYNDAGQVAFAATLRGTDVTGSNNRGFYRSDGVTTVQILRTGQTAPETGADVRFFGNINVLDVNELGKSAVRVALTGTGVTIDNNSALYRGDENGLVLIAREGQAAPSGVGLIGDFNSGAALNDADQMAFFATLTGTGVSGTNDIGLFYHDDVLGLQTIAREGDPFLGSTITGLAFNTGGTFGDEFSGLNKFGSVAYGYSLADGGSGIAIFSVVPEPAIPSLLAVGMLTLLPRRGERGLSRV